MPSNKDRLYIVLYARGGTATMPGGEDEYHWGLLVGPKTEVENGKGIRFHAKERMLAAGQSEWYFEERDVGLLATSMQLVRIMIGKIEKMDRLVSILRRVPIRQGQRGWNCVSWVKEALESLNADGKALGTSVTAWQAVRDGAMWYIQKKKAEHRFDGRGNFDMRFAATYDLLGGKETVP
ncbi:hypothetical protein LOCC1_G003694 [Lachnellula occidentalis]|uniref:Uncharacterized protein n=1 Tax=Lachnellula occidentalis TaxID=215460 RepID=A0A8H8UJ28_9HELO|nr:hypothetical protein LOCC1_G003694 [Lachnellula occidentalis]